MNFLKISFILFFLFIGFGFLFLNTPENEKLPKFNEKTNLKFGLDLVGGAQLLFQGVPTEQVKIITPEIMLGVEKVIDKRINPEGTSETTVQRVGKDTILIEIPGQSPESVKSRLLKTAKLEFKELDETGNWVQTGITGADLSNAQPVSSPDGRTWFISFEMKGESAEKFGKLTGRLLQGILPNGKQAQPNLPLAIFLDDELLSAPSVQGQIRDQGQISGKFTKEKAVELAVQLKAGALPVPLKLISERTVSPTLGAESLQKSLFAGTLGVGIIILFLIFIYRLPGFLASLGLLCYILVSMGLFAKMVTLTSAGIAGFILSIGMATDANILISERIKEEIFSGKGVYRAVEDGFKMAFPSIFDSNLNTLIVCLILLIFGSTIVKGFAVTLALGVITSFFSAIFLTRQLVLFAFKIQFLQKPFFYGVSKK